MARQEDVPKYIMSSEKKVELTAFSHLDRLNVSMAILDGLALSLKINSISSADTTTPSSLLTAVGKMMKGY